MKKGDPIYDSFIQPWGTQIETNGFLRAERNIL